MEAPQTTLPTGVVTFLLTDVEGSTRLWEREPDAMRSALSRHDAIVGACVRRQNGAVVKSKGEGDSVFAVFRHARDAVNAALIIQVALGMEQWATRTPIRVRMAIHTGQVDLRDGDYFGPPVNRCARLRALARGGQVLISGVSAQLVRLQLPATASLNDLGTHQLKDLSAPERVWQLCHPQLNAVASADSRPSVPAVAQRQAYMITDQLNRTTHGFESAAGVTHTAHGRGEDDLIRCYASPKLAALLNPAHERIRHPRLWEVTVDQDVTAGAGILECTEVTTRRQVALPSTTALEHARFAVLCALSAFAESGQAVEFSQWAEGWLAGMDSSGVQARAIADTFESAADLGSGVAHHEALLAATAARSAMHSARTTWLVGRARDEDNTRAVDLAAESVGLAHELVTLNLAELADRALSTSSRTLARA